MNALVARYAQRLEHHARSAPYNWFNFYDFWQSDDPHANPLACTTPRRPHASTRRRPAWFRLRTLALALCCARTAGVGLRR